MHPLKILIFLLSMFSLTAHGAALSESDRLMRENSLLRSEVQLAKSTQIYVILDLQKSRVLIKGKGVVLQDLPLKSFTTWGAPVQPKALTLQRKTALIEPGREEIRPKKSEEEPGSELQALQLEDMPARFRLNFDEGIRVYVKPASTGLLSFILNLMSFLKSYLVTRPLGTLWNGLHRQNYTEIVLYLSETDAKSLYWSFLQTFHCLIASP